MWLVNQYSYSRLLTHAPAQPPNLNTRAWTLLSDISGDTVWQANPSEKDHGEPHIPTVEIYNASKYSFFDE